MSDFLHSKNPDSGTRQRRLYSGVRHSPLVVRFSHWALKVARLRSMPVVPKPTSLQRMPTSSRAPVSCPQFVIRGVAAEVCIRNHAPSRLRSLRAIPCLFRLGSLPDEVGPDLSRFSSAAAFASWLGLCPDNRISGGKILSVATRKVKNRLAVALRMAAQSLHRSQSYLGQYYRRMRTRLGTPAAITAAAHKLARILYHLITTRQPYLEATFAEMNELVQKRQFLRLAKQAATLGYKLDLVESVP